MNKLWAFCACLCLIGPAYADQQKSLALGDAIHLALEASPSVKGADADYGAAAGERRQAGAFINPTIGFDAENIGGTGIYSGADGAELTAGISQTVEIGGKRSARINAAGQGVLSAQYSQQAARLDLVRDVTVAFANAAATQEQAAITAKQALLAKDVYQTVNRRVTAAAAPIMQRNKARISLANADLIAERAKGQKTAALEILGAFWSSDQLRSVAVDHFYKIEKPAFSADVSKLLKETVDYKQKSATAEQARSILDLERANAVPNPTIGIGLRDFRMTNDQALVASLSFPLPVFNLNRGNIDKARHLAAKADTDRQKLLLNGTASLAGHSQLLQNAWLTATKIKAVILPEAQEAFAQAKRGYNTGKFPYLEVLDAQRTLTDTRLAYIQALRDYHAEKAEVERLIAKDTTTRGKQ